MSKLWCGKCGGLKNSGCICKRSSDHDPNKNCDPTHHSPVALRIRDIVSNSTTPLSMKGIFNRLKIETESQKKTVEKNVYVLYQNGLLYRNDSPAGRYHLYWHKPFKLEECLEPKTRKLYKLIREQACSLEELATHYGLEPDSIEELMQNAIDEDFVKKFILKDGQIRYAMNTKALLLDFINREPRITTKELHNIHKFSASGLRKLLYELARDKKICAKLVLKGKDSY